MNDADPNPLPAPPSTCRAPTVRPFHHACREPTSRPSQRLSAHPCQEATTTFPPADLPHLPRLNPASPTASEIDSAMYPTPLVPPPSNWLDRYIFRRAVPLMDHLTLGGLAWAKIRTLIMALQDQKSGGITSRLAQGLPANVVSLALASQPFQG